MKKFRGQKRYYAKLSQTVEKYNLDTSEDSWYDFWHVHIDWYGYGNLGWKHRKQHLKVLFQIFEKFLIQAEEFKKPYQIWVGLEVRDASMDAVFVHTKNPNEDNFPVKFDNVDWSADPPQRYKELINQELYDFGILKGNYGTHYLFRSKRHGIPI